MKIKEMLLNLIETIYKSQKKKKEKSIHILQNSETASIGIYFLFIT
jgi:hypothetical protein